MLCHRVNHFGVLGGYMLTAPVSQAWHVYGKAAALARPEVWLAP